MKKKYSRLSIAEKSRLAIDWKLTKMARNFGADRTEHIAISTASPGVTSVWKIASHLRSKLSEMPARRYEKLIHGLTHVKGLGTVGTMRHVWEVNLSDIFHHAATNFGTSGSARLQRIAFFIAPQRISVSFIIRIQSSFKLYAPHGNVLAKLIVKQIVRSFYASNFMQANFSAFNSIQDKMHPLDISVFSMQSNFNSNFE